MENIIKLEDGQNITYWENDLTSAKTLLFLHGWGQSKECFAPILNKLDNVHWLAIDFPGFGNSPEPFEAIGVEKYAEYIEEFLKKKNCQNVTLVGHSFGARVGFVLTGLLGVKGIDIMILTGAAGVKPRRTLGFRIRSLGYKFKKLLVRTPFYYQYRDDLFSQSGSEDYKNASKIMKKVLIKVVNEDLQTYFSQIKIPVILFWGSDDEATPLKDAEIMSEKIADCELIVSKGSHYAFLEHSEQFLEIIKKKLNKEEK